MITVEIPIKDKKKPPALNFPDRCVHCGKPTARMLPLKLNTGAQKRGQMVQLEMSVPLCAECAAKEDRIANVTWIPFSIAGIILCILAFIPVWLITPEGPTLATREFDIVLGTFIGMVVGLVGGSAVEFVSRFLFGRSYGQLLLSRPLTVISFLSDVEHVIGLSAMLSKDKASLLLNFENDEIGRAFESLNVEEKK